MLFCCNHECRFGPLVRHMTMRYEAKHAYFKTLAQTIGNFINIPFTLAMRHQHLRCYLSTAGQDSEIQTGPGRMLTTISTSPYLEWLSPRAIDFSYPDAWFRVL